MNATWLKGILFLLLTAAFAYVSRASLAHPRSHGFYRFFVWLPTLALVLLNAEAWSLDPLSWHQIISWALLAVAAFLVIHGFYLLRRLGKPDARRDDTSTFGFEKTTELVTVGAYRYIRHPMYSSLLFFVWGVFFKAPFWLGALLALAATLLLVATARAEEAEDISVFGVAYEEYRKRTKMFIPFLF